MITETTRDKALAAAARGRTALVITQGEYPVTYDLTKLFDDGDIFIADVELEPLKEDVGKPVKLEKVDGKPEFVAPRKTIFNGGRKSTLDDNEILELYNRGWGYARIGNKLDVDGSTIRYHLRKMGVVK